jgi:CrcB protein
VRPAARPIAELSLVALGGAIGTLARYGAAVSVGDIGQLPLGILLINLSGAFGLGVLLELLALRGDDTGARRRLRLLLGTGVLGGFTTYSLLATDMAVMLRQGELVIGLFYGLLTLVGGGLASWFGILIAKKLHMRRPSNAIPEKVRSGHE